MTTSGTYVFDATTDQIITSSLRMINVLSEDQTLSSLTTNVQTNALFRLNTLLKALEADGMPLWAIDEVTIPFTSFTANSVNIGPGLTVNQVAPLKILQGRCYTTATSNSFNMTILTEYDYNTLSNANNTYGTPVNLYYHPYNGTGVLNIWPAPQGNILAGGRVIITYQRPQMDAGISTNTLDFPPYWTDCIIYGLAYRLAPEYGVPPADRNLIKGDYMTAHEAALSFGTEEGSFRFEPQRERG